MRQIIAFLVFARVSWLIMAHTGFSSFLSISGNFETGLVGLLVDKIVTDKDLFAVKILKNDRLVYERHSGLSSEKTVQAISRVVSGEKTIGSVEVYLGIRSEFLQAAATQEMVVFACFSLGQAVFCCILFPWGICRTLSLSAKSKCRA